MSFTVTFKALRVRRKSYKAKIALGLSLSAVFFFQAEDGIRDLTVTGVQTCALPIFRTAEDIRANVEPDTEVVGIDEGQFFDNDLIPIVNELAENGVRVIIAGLDQDYTGKPWEPMPQLLAVAEYITKTHAICMKCGQPANYTQRTFESEERVAVGGAGMYEARCRSCFVPHADAPTVH